MTLDDFIIYYKDKKIDNILMSSWMDVVAGFGLTKDEENLSRFEILIKIVFVGDDGIIKCIEDNSVNFKLVPKIIDHKE